MAGSSYSIPTHFQRFQSTVNDMVLPERFQYPFHYEPHPIALLAAQELQHYLQYQTDWEHDFGEIGSEDEIIGKMFGVLVVKTPTGELGYVCAVSGKLAGHNQHEKFVPPVFDILKEDGFFRKGEAIISEINARISQLQNNPKRMLALKTLQQAQHDAEQEINRCKALHLQRKNERQQQREQLQNQFEDEERERKRLALNHASTGDHYQLKQLKQEWKSRLESLEQEASAFDQEIDQLKQERKQRSAALQNEIFDEFFFVNQQLERRSVGDIFQQTPEGRPIAGAGECAAPKMLQYAFLNELHPIAMAEFWWGQSPKTEIRIHGHYYPACRGKCEPILGHMLSGLDIDANPLLQNPAEGKSLEVVWEDEHIVIVQKPHEFLSVPGRRIHDSVWSRLKAQYPMHPELLVAHRLDMSTSGLLMAAKTIDVYKALQRQFTEHIIQKRYVALLDGEIAEDEGYIDLPMRVDLENRPRQMVCHEHGKSAQTKWKVVERKDGRTKVHFYPITGRTHQLRVHAAHRSGLNTPILGDDLYGRRSTRLHLHAEWMSFIHPISNDAICVEAVAPNW